MIERLLLTILGMVVAPSLLAQPPIYPTKPVRLIVPYPPGGPADLIDRAANEPLAKRLGQTVIIDNRGGATSMIGAEIAARIPRGSDLGCPCGIFLSQKLLLA